MSSEELDVARQIATDLKTDVVAVRVHTAVRRHSFPISPEVADPHKAIKISYRVPLKRPFEEGESVKEALDSE